jgi:hypothetical protein
MDRKALFLLNCAAGILGVASAITFSHYHFTGEGCGLVRFYENATGVLVLGTWLLGCGVGLGLVLYGRTRARAVGVIGSLLIIVTNLGLCAVAVSVRHNTREADYTLKSTDLLIQLAQQEDDRLAVWELGERKAAQAVPVLCRVLDDTTKDINLRVNAAKSLGQICAAVRKSGGDHASAMDFLIRALSDREKFLRQTAAEALGKIGDERAVDPLIARLGDETEEEPVKAAAVDALGLIGDKRAVPPLRDLQKKDQGQYLGYRTRQALAKLER